MKALKIIGYMATCFGIIGIGIARIFLALADAFNKKLDDKISQLFDGL